jgi:hypothetical protein
LKTIDSLCEKVINAKYKKAILQAKLANLQKVAELQKKLLAEVNVMAEQKKEVSWAS